jgi:hypothetical protein
VTKYCDNRRRTKVIHSFGFIDGFSASLFSFFPIHLEVFRALLEFPLRSFIPGSGWRAGGIHSASVKTRWSAHRKNLFLAFISLENAQHQLLILSPSTATWAVRPSKG